MIKNGHYIKDTPDQDYLLECFDYNKDTGALVRKRRPLHHFKDIQTCNKWNGCNADRIVYSKGKDGYIRVNLDDSNYKAHRLIWKMYYGVEPDCYLDHINGNKEDNRIENLRDIDNTQNQRNITKLGVRNKSGYTGVSFNKDVGKWKSELRDGEGVVFLGYYFTKEEAALERELKAVELYGEEFYYANEKNKILLEELKTKAENLKTTILLPKIRSTVTNKLGYNGVEQTKGGRFRAAFAKQGCGCFDTVEEAALAYEYKLIEVYGKLCLLYNSLANSSLLFNTKALNILYDIGFSL